MPFKLASPLMNPSSHSMQTSPDVEAQVPGAGQHISIRFAHDAVSSIAYPSPEVETKEVTPPKFKLLAPK
jgi:hypothetical protein